LTTAATRPPKPVSQIRRYRRLFLFVLVHYDPLPLFFFRPIQDASLLITEPVETAVKPFMLTALPKIDPQRLIFSSPSPFPHTPEAIY